MVRTNVVLDEQLIKKCLKTTGIKTRRALIDFALKELLRHEAQTQLMQLKGNIDWEGNLDDWRKGYTQK